MGHIQLPAQADLDNPVDGTGRVVYINNNLDGRAKGIVPQAATPDKRRAGLTVGRDIIYEALGTAVRNYHRRMRFEKFPWKPGEMEAAIASYTGPITQCPPAYAGPTFPQHPQKAKLK